MQRNFCPEQPTLIAGMWHWEARKNPHFWLIDRPTDGLEILRLSETNWFSKFIDFRKPRGHITAEVFPKLQNLGPFLGRMVGINDIQCLINY